MGTSGLRIGCAVAGRVLIYVRKAGANSPEWQWFKLCVDHSPNSALAAGELIHTC